VSVPVGGAGCTTMPTATIGASQHKKKTHHKKKHHRA
jgi:hypothetical protein